MSAALCVVLLSTCEATRSKPCAWRCSDQFAVSSLHLTFNTAEESSSLAEVGYLQRSGIQFHWENRGYTTFEDFLSDLKQSKRKNIRQVRVIPLSACW